MAYEKKEQLYEGKAKKVYATQDPNVVIVSYKDDAAGWRPRVCPPTWWRSSATAKPP